MRIRSSVVLAVAAVAGSVPAAASQVIDELVVTVRKSEENVQDIPLQVSLLNEDIIEKERVRTLSDVALLTPSIQFDTGFWPSDTRISIRGLFARAGRPSAAVLIDGIDAMSESLESSGGSALLNQRVLDLQRVEVARGPQSALYGRGAFSGAINYVTRRPEPEWNGSALVDAAEYGRFETQLSGGGPLFGDSLAFRAMASRYEFDGFYRNPNTGSYLGAGESNGLGLGFLWSPTDRLDAYWNTTWSKDESGPTPIVVTRADSLRVVQNDGFGNTTLIPSGSSADCTSPGSGAEDSACLLVVTGTLKADESQLNIAPDPRDPSRDYPGTDDETLRSSLIIDWDLSDAAKFRSATSVTDADQRLAIDPSNTFGLSNLNLPGVVTSDVQSVQRDQLNRFDIKQFYQEFQLSGVTGESINWLVGLNGFWEDASTINNSSVWFRNPIACAFFMPTPACSFSDSEMLDKNISRDTTSYSAFGLVGWQMTEQLKVTFEGRLIRDEIEIATNTADILGDSVSAPPGFTYNNLPGFSDKLSDTNFVPRASIEFRASDDVMVYASVANGIKPPTFNTTDLADPVLARVEKEKLWTYEVGAKTQSADGRVTLNGALFYNDYKDQQVRISLDGLNPGDLPRSGVANAGKVTVWGIEIDSSWQVTDNLLLTGSYAFTDGEYDEFVLADISVQDSRVSIGNRAKAGNLTGDFSGRETPGNPRHAAAFLGRYERALNSDLDWYLQGTLQYQGKRWADVANLVKLESYWLAGLQAGLQADTWFMSVYAENLFDDDTVRYGQEFIDFQQGFQLSTFTYPVAYYSYLPSPRVVGVKVQFKTR